VLPVFLTNYFSFEDGAGAGANSFGNFFDGLLAPQPCETQIAADLFQRVLNGIRELPADCYERPCSLKST
jgi:hypothetical protein